MTRFRTTISRSQSHAGRFSTPSSGISLMEVIVVIVIIGILCILLAPAIQMGREAARRAQCRNHLKQLGVAISAYTEQYTCLPPGAIAFNRFSIHTVVLPHFGRDSVYNSINFQHPNPFIPPGVRGGKVNLTAALSRIDLFACPSDPIVSYGRSPGIPHPGTNYAGNTGIGGAVGGAETGLFKNRGGIVRPQDVRDGFSNTIAMSEWVRGPGGIDRNHPLGSVFNLPSSQSGWGASFVEACQNIRLGTDEIANSDKGAFWIDGELLSTLYNHTLGPNGASCMKGGDVPRGAFTANSMHPSGINSLFGDGSVRLINGEISLLVWRALATRAGDEVVGNAEF